MRRWAPSALWASGALCLGAWSLVASGRVAVGTYLAFVLAVASGGRIREALGGSGRRATYLTQGVLAAVVLTAAGPALFPLPSMAGGTEESWRFLANLMLVPAVMLTADLTTRSAKAMTVFAGLVLLAAAGSLPGAHSLGPLLVAYTVVAVVAMAALEQESDPQLPMLGGASQPAGVRFDRRRVLAVLLALAAVVPVAMAARPSPPIPASRDGDRPGTDGTLDRYAGFSDRLDTGDRFELSNEVVMRVRADAPDFWRGTTYDIWDGRSWLRSPVSPVQIDRTETFVLVPGDGDPVDGSEFAQTFTIEMAGTDVMFGAYRMSRVRLPAGLVAQYDDGTVRRRDPLSRGAVYSVVSSRPDVTAAALRAHDPRLEQFSSEFRERYLQLPDVPDRVRSLARELAQGQPTTYDVIQSMQQWMGDNTSYTLDIPALAGGADAVEQFLFVDRKGFCEQIASSLAVMLRSLGIPARVATGYVPGDQDAASGEFLVRASDAHAWVEVFFPGIGWQAFDPTARVPLSGEFDQSFVGRLKRSVGAMSWVLVLVVALAAVVLLAFVAREAAARRRHRRPAVVLVRRLEREGARRGRARAPAEPLTHYCEALANSVLRDDRLGEVGAAVTSALYGPSSATGDVVSVSTAGATLTEVCRAIPAPRRWRRPRT